MREQRGVGGELGKKNLKCSKAPGQVQPLVRSPTGVQGLTRTACLRTIAMLRALTVSVVSSEHGGSRGWWLGCLSLTLLLQI